MKSKVPQSDYERALVGEVPHEPLSDDEIRELGWEPTVNGWRKRRNPRAKRQTVRNPTPERRSVRNLVSDRSTVLAPREPRAKREPRKPRRTPSG